MSEQEGALRSRNSGQLVDLKADVRQRGVILGWREKPPLQAQSTCVIRCFMCVPLTELQTSQFVKGGKDCGQSYIQ